ncbi:MAG: DUF3794 domain-containing protein [Faecousia sp.]
MELQFEKTDCRFLQKLVSEVISQEETQEVRLPDAMPDAGRILAAWGQIMLRGKEWRSSAMIVSGGVMVWVLYAPEDGSEPRRLDSWIPFQTKWEIPQTERDGVIRVQPLLRSVDARCLSARKLMLRANMEILGEALVEQTAPVYHPGQVPEGVELLRESYLLELPREAGEKTFTMDEELNLPGNAPALQRLIRYEMQPRITEQKVVGDKALFRGTGNLHILYMGEDSRLHGWDFEVPFSQYADLEREYDREASLQTLPVTTNLELDLGEEGLLHIKCGLLGQYMVSEQEPMELVQDAYSVRADVQMQTAPLELPVYLDRRSETVPVRQTMHTDGKEPADLVFYSGFPRIAGTEQNTALTVPGMFQCLWYNEDGTLQSATARAETEVPFPVGEDCTVRAMVGFAGKPQASLSGADTQTHGDVMLNTVTEGCGRMNMVTGLMIGEERVQDPERPSLIVRRIGEEQSLWELAKGCGSTVEAIRKLNHCTEEPAANQMLLIPVL